MGRKSSSRVEKLFRKAQDFTLKSFPSLPPLSVKFCVLADRDHEKEWRVFAHMGHEPGVVCWAKAAEEELFDEEILGISFHELGHVIAEKIGGLPGHGMKSRGGSTPQPMQDEANEIVRQFLRIPVYYNKRSLEEVSLRFI